MVITRSASRKQFGEELVYNLQLEYPTEMDAITLRLSMNHHGVKGVNKILMEYPTVGKKYLSETMILFWQLYIYMKYDGAENFITNFFEEWCFDEDDHVIKLDAKQF